MYARAFSGGKASKDQEEPADACCLLQTMHGGGEKEVVER